MRNLPKRNATHIQEDRSRNAFCSILPSHLFVCRNQFESDYGTDILIELVTLSGYVTNYQCQIQLKSQKNGKFRMGGGFSYPVPVKTINYLINQPNSLFIIYLENMNTFYWEWADIINNYFFNSGDDLSITDKKSVSYTFKKELDEEAFKEIYNHILNRSKMINDLVNIINVKNDEPIHISIDGKEEKIINYVNIEKQIIKYGFELCNKGDYKTLSSWIQKLPISAKGNEKLALVVSYYMTHIGNYLNALNWLPKIKKGNAFDEEELYLIEYLSLNIKNALGLITYEEYLTKLKSLADENSENILGLQAKLNYKKLCVAMNKIDDDSVIKEFNEIIRIIKNMPNVSQLIIENIEIEEFEVEGILILQEMIRNSFKIVAHMKSNYSLTKNEIDKIFISTKNRLEKWIKKYDNIICNNSIDLLIKSRYILTFSSTYLLLFEVPKILEIENELTAEDKESLNKLAENLKWAFFIFDSAGLVHESLNAKWGEANTHKKLGDKKLYNDIIQFIIDGANDIGFASMVKEATDSLSNTGIFVEPQSLSDEDLKLYAFQYLQAFDLPSDRFDNVYKDYCWTEKDRKEKYNWCTHIGTIQDLRHTCSKNTKYSYDPSRLIVCLKFNFKPLKPGYEREILIADFKSKYCRDCKERSPGKNTQH
ncbi:MAG: DUF4365 domain-containing protein [Peptostreptococcaceae bacterium]|nr:DUF4365 domain-containing protein [Peptostreptococcaceae bacterium]